MNRLDCIRIVMAGSSLAACVVFRPLRAAVAAEAESLTVAQVRAMLKAAPGHANFKGKRLINLDLGNLDFRGANFDKCDLLETTFHGANLANASFVDAYLSATKFPDAKAQGARFTGATFLSTAEGANFSGADLSRTSGYLVAPRGKFVNTNLSRAMLSPEMSNQPMGLLHTILSEADLTGANLAGANLSFANLSSAKLTRANVRGANFYMANLNRADFSGADVSEANFSKADIAQALFVNVRGRTSMRGLESAINRDQANFGSRA